MTRLRLTVSPLAGETFQSIITRIAARNGASFAQDFCADMALTWREITRGNPEAVRSLAILANIPMEKMERFAVRSLSHHEHSINGEYLTSATLPRRELTVCPLCLEEDVKKRGALARYCRVEWLVGCYRNCHIHHIPMLALPDAEYPRCQHDFYQRVEDHWRVIVRSASATVSVKHGVELEKYLAKRLRGKKTNKWCDQLDLDLICRLCEWIGIVLTLGAKACPTHLEAGQMSRAASTGFEALSRGPQTLETAFRAIRDASTSTNPGFQADFGVLSRRLERVDHDDPRYARFLDLLTEFAFANYPYDKGDALFGRSCKSRQIHCINTAAKKHGMNGTRTARLAVALGLGAIEQGQRIRFSAPEYDPILAEFSECITPKQAAIRLGAWKGRIPSLAASGMLLPRFNFPEMMPVYHPDDIDAFLETIERHAIEVSEVPRGYIALTTLGKHAKCQLETIIKVAQEGRLETLCKLKCANGLGALYADLEDLRDQIQKPAPDAFTKRDLQQVLRVNSSTVTFLVQEQMLPATIAPHHRSRRPVALISRQTVEGFLETHATLGMMAYAAKTQAKHVATKLERAGIDPLPLGERNSKIYVRTPELEAMFDTGSQANGLIFWGIRKP